MRSSSAGLSSAGLSSAESSPLHVTCPGGGAATSCGSTAFLEEAAAAAAEVEVVVVVVVVVVVDVDPGCAAMTGRLLRRAVALRGCFFASAGDGGGGGDAESDFCVSSGNGALASFSPGGGGDGVPAGCVMSGNALLRSPLAGSVRCVWATETTPGTSGVRAFYPGIQWKETERVRVLEAG